MTALLALHSIAMNGGVLHAIEFRSAEEIKSAADGYRYFGLDEAAAVVEWVQREAASIDLESEHAAAERLEVEGNERYAALVPDDSTLVLRFEARFRKQPEAFAPL